MIHLSHLHYSGLKPIVCPCRFVGRYSKGALPMLQFPHSFRSPTGRPSRPLSLLTRGRGNSPPCGHSSLRSSTSSRLPQRYSCYAPSVLWSNCSVLDMDMLMPTRGVSLVLQCRGRRRSTGISSRMWSPWCLTASRRPWQVRNPLFMRK